MFMKSNLIPGKLDEGFARPVESIMRCEDFKSNFARKLSNRYISRPIFSPRQDVSLKLRSADNIYDERTEPSQLSKSVTEQNGEAVKPPDKQTKNADIRSTEVTALNMEVDTLRWQLAQTEANRQMHIALLKQIVTFLSRVKDHIESQKSEECKDTNGTERSFALTDLPRSRSVLYVNKNLDYSPSKKIYTRKISKSISNVNGFKDYSVGNPSKIVLTYETETTQKITEEMSRLITLANTVLSTKIPDLACTCNDIKLTATKVSRNINNDLIDENESNASSNLMEEESNGFMLNTVRENEIVQVFDGITNKIIETECSSVSDYIVSPLPLICGLEDEFNEVKIIDKEDKKLEMSKIKPGRTIEKKNDYNHTTHFIEDESGFSSMSSFQEIGIPIISIIPPSPCKEVDYIDGMPNVLDETEKWKNKSIDLEKQTVKVFWV